MVQKDKKFEWKSELELFKALQKYGKLSNEVLFKKTGMPTTTIQRAYQRLQTRKFYQIKALPKLEQFPELPLAVIGFAKIHPIRLKQALATKEPFIMAIFHNEKELLLILTAKDNNQLAQYIFDLMELLQARPILHLFSPSIAKIDMTIPDEVLEAVYGNLPDKRRK